MNQKDILARLKHVDFPTQQRRLRHLRSVAARNLTLAKRLSGLSGINKLGTYFTLHKDEQAPAFYTSETITGSLNPTWRSFSVQHMESDINATQPFVVVRVWQTGDSGEAVVTLQWNAHLSGLCYIGYQIKREDVHYSPNTLILGLHDGFYAAPPEEFSLGRGVLSLFGTPYTAWSCEVEQVLIKASYSPHSLARIQTVLCALQQTIATVNRVKHSITSRLHHCRTTQTKKSEKESILFRVNKLRADLESRTVKLQTLKENYELKQTANYQREIGVKNKFEKLQKDLQRLNEKKKAYFEIREGHIKTGAQLVMRRKQLVSELSCIYPIHQINKDTFTICHVELPNSEAFYGRNETMIAVSLGYTCHLVSMISLFLDVPLRYPTDNLGSRSQIHDHVIDKLADKERNFPLYSKGKEKFQFQYGVYLLNKNIAQLRYYCGLGTSDLRTTLANLQSLLQLRLGVKFDSGSRSAARAKLNIPTECDETDMTSLRSALEMDRERAITKGNNSNSSSEPLDSPESDQTSSHSSKATGSRSHSCQNSPTDQDELPAGINIQDVLHEKQTFSLNNDSVAEGNDSVQDNSVSDEMFGSVHSARLTALSSGYDASSSEDSGTCGSHFKQWPGASSSLSPLPNNDLLGNGTSHMTTTMDDVAKPQDINPEFIPRTFKTKAMHQPKTRDEIPLNNEAIPRFVPELGSHDKLGSSDELATFSVPYLLQNNTSSSSDMEEQCKVKEHSSSD